MLCCFVLCCFVLCCVVLCCVVLRIGLLQYPVCVMPLGSCLRFENLLQSITNNGVKNTTQHNITQHNTTQHNTTQHNTTQHNTTQHNTTQNNTTQHNTTQHNTTQHKICGFVCCHRGDRGGGGFFSGPCWACVNTTQEGVGGYFLPLCWPAVLTRLFSLANMLLRVRADQQRRTQCMVSKTCRSDCVHCSLNLDPSLSRKAKASCLISLCFAGRLLACPALRLKPCTSRSTRKNPRLSCCLPLGSFAHSGNLVLPAPLFYPPPR